MQLLLRGKDDGLEVNLLLLFLRLDLTLLSLDALGDHVIELNQLVPLQLLFVVLVIRLNVLLEFLHLFRGHLHFFQHFHKQ